MTFEELGAALRAEREKRNLTIDQVVEQLKINPRLLMALEAGEGNQLPHPAYVRGFIRSYASFLGFGPEEIQNMLAGLQPADPRSTTPRKPIPAPGPAEIPDLPPKQKRAKGSAVWLALVLICAICGGAWWAWDNGYLGILKRTQEKPADLLKSLPGADAYLSGRDTPKAPEQKQPEPVIAGLSRPANPVASIPKPAPSESEPASAPVQEPQQKRAVESESDTPPKAEVAEPEDQGAQEAQPDQHKLVIVAIEECWVHSNADKTDTRQFSLRKGDTFALTFAKSLDLKLGNAGGVRLRYDGRDLPPPGSSGQVKTLSFPPKEE